MFYTVVDSGNEITKNWSDSMWAYNFYINNCIILMVIAWWKPNETDIR